MKNDIIEFEEKLYNYLDKELVNKLNDIKNYLFYTCSNKVINKLNDIIKDVQNVAYEYRQFNKNLNELLYEDNEDNEQGEN